MCHFVITLLPTCIRLHLSMPKLLATCTYHPSMTYMTKLVTYLSPTYHICITYISHMYHLPITYVSPTYHICITYMHVLSFQLPTTPTSYISPMYHLCTERSPTNHLHMHITYVSPTYRPCVSLSPSTCYKCSEPQWQSTMMYV